MNKQVLNDYFKESGLSLAQMEKKVSPNFAKFLTGEKNPSNNQLIKIAKQLDIPLGLLLLDRTVEKPISKLKFRTINSEYKIKHSTELNDTIAEMQEKQNFLKSQIDTDLDFVGKFSLSDNYLDVVRFIRQKLDFTFDFNRKIKRDNYFKFLREKISRIGVFVFLNGKVKDNSHRPLNIDEFRGFVLLDKKAPIIFINQRDSKNGQIFTLIHELTHLLIGDEEILGRQDPYSDYDKIEAFVNKVTAEFLVPNDQFKRIYMTNKDVSSLANVFKVSRYVIVRRMLDDRFISLDRYRKYVTGFNNELKHFNDLNNHKGSGGDYGKNLNFRMDHTFFRYVENALNSQEISYTDAFNIIGVGYKGYHALKEG